MLTFEGQRYSGDQKIVEKLAGLPFQKVQHQVVTVDAQPSNPQPGPILVSVTGRLLVIYPNIRSMKNLTLNSFLKLSN